MFDRLTARGARMAAGRAAARRRRLAARIEDLAPDGVQVSEDGERVVLAGRGVIRRFVLDPRLRWLVTEARDER
jgi:sugar lactone lactonase YvrE